VLISTGLWAQLAENWCHTDHVYKEAYDQDPDLFKRLERTLDEAVVAYGETAGKKDDGRTYYIPVVFHYFHPVSQANHTAFFGEAAADATLERINNDFNRNNSDSNDIQPFYKTFRRGNARIKFVRAQLDPHGNPTNGIVYIATDKTKGANRNTDDELKYMSFWPSDKYLNFWIAEELKAGAGVLAFATLPEFVASGLTRSSQDGVMGLLDCFRANISDRFYRHAISHECGHWLGLRHPFEGDGSILEEDGSWSGCSSIDCKFGGDKICDIGQVRTIYQSGACSSSPANSCENDELPDNWTNIMDYRYCPAMFSRGQVTRMRGTLISHRANIVSWENLQTTGINDEIVTEIRGKTSVYPNPFSDKIVIEIELQNDATACIEIKDLLGRSAYQDCKKKLHQGINKIEISANEMHLNSTGVYLVQITVGEATIVKRLQYTPGN